MELIRLEHLSKVYDHKTVLDKIDHTFHQGRSVAFVGHNGCGKSTLLKMMAKLIVPTSGKVVYGRSLLFHYIPEKFPSVPLTAREYLLRMGAMSGMRKKEAEQNIESLGNDFFLEEMLDAPMQNLSKGTLQKVGVMQALMKRPDVLLLDEPLSGQDAASQKVFIDKINLLRSEGVTVFMACHEKQLVRAIAEEALTIQNGVLSAYEPEEERLYCVILEGDGILQPIEGMTQYGRYYRIRLAEETCDKILPGLLKQGWRLRGMEYDENR